MSDRKTELLVAVLDFLDKLERSCHADALSVLAVYDEAECDGYCLMEDLKCELGLD